MTMLICRVRFARCGAGCRRTLQFRLQGRWIRSVSAKYHRHSKTGRRTSPQLRAYENGKEKLPELSLFKQLETELESLGNALVKIQQTRSSGAPEDETLLTTLIEEVQREQEAWYKQVQVMERLVAQAATLEAGEVELQDLRQKYEEMRRKVELYNGLLDEREREVDSLKQQLQDVNTAVELKELKSASLKELVAPDGKAMESDLRLPKWSTDAVSNFFVKDEQVEEETVEEKPQLAILDPSRASYLKRMEVPGLAVISVLSLLSQVSGQVWDSATSGISRETKALVEVAMLCVLLGVATTIASSGFF